jgi:hypothetical protein
VSRKVVATVVMGLVMSTFPAISATADQSPDKPKAPKATAVEDTDDNGVLDAASASKALAGAASKNRPVEDLSQRTETFSTVANPDGTFTATEHAAAVRVLHGSEWVDVDNDLQKQSDGTYSPKASIAQVSVSGGGTKEAARVNFRQGKSLAITWPETLPTPTVKGPVATYALSDATDLLVTATGSGVAAHLRLNSRPAADDPIFSFGLRTEDLTVTEARGGGLKVTDDDKNLGTTSKLVAWDSRVDEAGDPAKIVSLDADLTDVRQKGDTATQTLNLTAPSGYLSDPKTVYPVIIDPTINAANLIRDTYTRAGDTTPAGTQSKLLVGRQSGSSNTSPARTLIQWQNTFLAGKTVTSASMNFYQYFSGSCSAKDVNIHPLVGEFYESTTVDTNRPSVDTGTGDSSILTANRGPSCPNGSGFVSASVLKLAQAWAKGPSAGGYGNWGVQLNVPSASGTDLTYERRFCSEELSTTPTDACTSADRVPFLTFTYSDPAPVAPSKPEVTLNAAGDATISTTVAGASNTNLRARFQVTENGATVWEGYSESVPGGTKASVFIEDVNPGSYAIRAWSNNGGESSVSPSSTVVVRNMGQLQTKIDSALTSTSSEAAASAPDLQMPGANDPTVRLLAGTESLLPGDDPADANDAMTLSMPTSGSTALMSDGISRSYDGATDSSNVVVQPLGDAARALVVLDSATAPERYDFTLGGEVASLEVDEPDPESGDPGGGVTAYNAQGDIIGLVDAPWAVDANGWPLPTWYETNGTTMTQVIIHDADTNYPVVADPDFVFMAKCGLGVAEFLASNVAYVAKIKKVFKNAKAIVKLFKDIRKMSKASRKSYFLTKLGSIAGSVTGVDTLINRCTP